MYGNLSFHTIFVCEPGLCAAYPRHGEGALLFAVYFTADIGHVTGIYVVPRGLRAVPNPSEGGHIDERASPIR